MNAKIKRIKKRNASKLKSSIPKDAPVNENSNVKRIWKELLKLIPKTLEVSDSKSLLNLARSLDALDDIQKEIEKNGRFVIAQSGIYKDTLIISAIEQHRIKAETQCLQLLKEFHLTPKSMSVINKTKDEKAAKETNIFGA